MLHCFENRHFQSNLLLQLSHFFSRVLHFNHDICLLIECQMLLTFSCCCGWYYYTYWLFAPSMQEAKLSENIFFFPKGRMGMGSNRDRFSLSNQSTRPVTPYSLLLVTKPFDNNVWERYIYINIIYHPIKCISVTEATRKKILINFGSSKSNTSRI